MVRLMAKTLDELNAAAQHYYFTAQQIGIDNRCRERMISRCLLDHKPGRVLELGFMDGQWTDHFLRMGCNVTVVEGALRNVEFGRSKYAGNPEVEIIHGTFEDYRPAKRFDCMLMGGMLKHLDDPLGLLRRAREWISPGGKLIATTPNARSLHRRLGVAMGLLKTLDALSPTDIKVGNLRHYDLASFRDLLISGGYTVETIGTAVLKPVSSDRMSDWPDDLLDALDTIADELPDYGWYIYAIAYPHSDR
jgi:SAM-dependent methyltransferase